METIVKTARYDITHEGNAVRPTADANPVLTNITVLATSTTNAFASPAVGLDASNRPHVLYKQNSEIFHTFNGNTGWTPAFNVSNTSTASSAPSIYVHMSNNSAHVAWQELVSPSNNEVYYRVRSANGNWGGIQNLSNNSSHSVEPFISGPVSSGPMVTWSDASSGNYESNTISLSTVSPEVSKLHRLDHTFRHSRSEISQTRSEQEHTLFGQMGVEVRTT